MRVRHVGPHRPPARRHEDVLGGLAGAVGQLDRMRIGDPGAGDERAFLEAFYAQLRAKLEGDMRFGKRKANKFS